MTYTDEQHRKLEKAQEILDYRFSDKELILAAITHPSATEGMSVKFSYERLEFLGDSILGAIVATEAFNRFPELDEGGLTRIKISLVAGYSLSDIGAELGFADVIVFGSSETGTGKRGLHSALENVYEAVVAALYLDGGLESASAFVERTLLPKISTQMALQPDSPKSALQQKLQQDGVTPTYKLIETQGPPHDRTFISQVFVGMQGLARGVGRTKKEAESQAAKSALENMGDVFHNGMEKAVRNEKAAIKAEKAAAKAEKAAAKAEEKARKKTERENAKQKRQG